MGAEGKHVACGGGMWVSRWVRHARSLGMSFPSASISHGPLCLTPFDTPAIAPVPCLPSAYLQIESLSAVVEPGSPSLPEAVLKYRPPAGVAKKTSYDALKAAGHRAAGDIDMWRRQANCSGVAMHWVESGGVRAAHAGYTAAPSNKAPPRCSRRHGSVYKTQGRPSAAAADPYEAIREALGKGRRQELFSFAAAQLLEMGIPERTALLLRFVWLPGGGMADDGGKHVLMGALFSTHWVPCRLPHCCVILALPANRQPTASRLPP